MGAPGGGYAYFHGDGQSGGVPTYTIVNQQRPGGSPVAVNTPRNNGSHEPQRQAHSGGRGKEKGGKGRRGGGNNNGRKGGEQKNPTSSVSSPLLETFKAKKNRDWTALDIKGTR